MKNPKQLSVVVTAQIHGISLGSAFTSGRLISVRAIVAQNTNSAYSHDHDTPRLHLCRRRTLFALTFTHTHSPSTRMQNEKHKMQMFAVDAVCFYATIVDDARLPFIVCREKIVKGAFACNMQCNDKWKKLVLNLCSMLRMCWMFRSPYKQFCEHTLTRALTQSSLQHDWKQKQNENKQKIPNRCLSRMWVRAHTVFIVLMPSIY